jgi:hypothetical protein
VYEHDEFYDEDLDLMPEDGEEDWVDSAVKATPWWAISVGTHVVLILIAAAMILSAEIMDKPDPAIVELTPEPPPEMEYVEPEKLFEHKEIVKEKMVEQPVFQKNMEIDPKPETDADQPFDELLGEEDDVLEKTKFESATLNDSIGVGGPAGGGKGFRGRGGDETKGMIGGMSPTTETAVLEGLKWLSRHQHENGAWRTDAYHDNCGAHDKYPGSCSGDGYAEFDSGVTGLALLAFLGSGYTHLSKDTYDGICFGTVVKKGLQWLMSQQDGEGYIGRDGSGRFMYNHSVATLALTEAYGLTASPLFKDNAQKGINALLQAQNPYKAWRYTIKPGDNDTSVTGWAVMALKSADISGLSVGQQGYQGAIAWFDEVTEKSYYRVGYDSLASAGKKVIVKGKNESFNHHESMTAVGMLCRIFIDKNRNDPKVKAAAELLVQDLPSLDKDAIDYYYWYYASLALFQYDGPKGNKWESWNNAMVTALVKSQHTDMNCLKGSWDTRSRWAFEGGRVYTTAINTLTLEVYYRYETVFGGGRD